MTHKKRVAVFFGGRSPEHDVSVVSGLQILQAIDTNLYDPFPVYVTPSGQWFIGDALRARANYMFSEQGLSQLTPVNLDISANASGCLHILNQGIFKKAPILFDIALPVFHGSFGENGGFQGLMEFANVAYAGMRAKAAQIFMDKDVTKRALMHAGIPMLPHATIERP
ncbi:MAG: D-alanine--D-alanine ligase, partial [Pseudomonadota bacterium]